MKFLWISLFALFLVELGVGRSTSAGELEAFFANRDGVKHLQGQSSQQAYQDFLRAIDQDPLNPVLQLNLARTFEANEDFVKAEQGYLSALSILPKDSKLYFETLFNLAGVLAKQQKIPEALAAYQRALEINPDSLEVKTNIELLWQQGGGGSGKNQNKDQNKDQQQDQDKNQQQKDQDSQKENEPKQEKKKNQPKPFKSEELSPQDVKKILDEIKNQEQGIRAQDYERGAKESPRGKDW